MKRMTCSLVLVSLVLAATSCSHNKPSTPEATVTVPATPAVATDGAPAPAAPKAVSATTYTCPMDADVVRAQPGKCPKCGMALVKK